MKEKRIKKWWLIRLALTIVGKKGLREMTRASKDGKKASDGILRQILTTCKDTVYGKEHHFEEILKAATPDELFRLYQKYVPMNDYEDLRPYIERHKKASRILCFRASPKCTPPRAGRPKSPSGYL